MFRKIFAFAVILGLIASSAAFVAAEPYKDIVVGEGETVIPAAWFDGGEGNYYKVDPEAGNKDIRPDEGVATHDYDKQGGFVGGRAESGLSCIGWIAAEEWVQYTIRCEVAGVYNLGMWGGAGPGGEVKFSRGGRTIGSVYVEDNGGGWQDYALYDAGNFHMPKGTHVIRVDFLDGGINFESFVLTLVEAREDAPPVVWVPKNFSVTSSKTLVTATDFDPGVYGKAPADGFKELRPDEDVNTQYCDNGQFEGNIGWIGAGDWVQYTVDFQRPGMYKFDAWIASDAPEPGNVAIYLDGKPVGESPDSNKDGWQTYSLFPVGEAVAIEEGSRIIKVEFPKGGLNLAAFEITRTGDIPVETEPPPAEDKGGGAEGADVGDGDAAPTAEELGDDEGGGNMVLIIIIGAAVVVVVVAIIVLVATKKKK